MDLAAFGLTDITTTRTVVGVPLTSARFPVEEHDRVWRELRAARPETGLWPVLGADAAQIAENSERFGEHQGPDWLAYALTIDPAEHMALIRRSFLEWCLADSDPADPGHRAGIDYFRSDLTPALLAPRLPERVPTPPGRREGSSRTWYDGGVVTLVPARAGFEVLASARGLLDTGNWCGGESHPKLTPLDQIVVLRHFEERYGAELYHVGHGMELAVSSPPVTREAVALCAIEQYSFCPDLEEAAHVALTQAPAAHWHFWWD